MNLHEQDPQPARSSYRNGVQRFITFNNETLSQGEWAKRIGIGAAALSQRLKRSSLEKALTDPPDKRSRDRNGRMLPGRSVPKGALNPGWKGGRILDSKGYIRALCPGHPRQDSRGYVKEHILVVEKAMGKLLRSTAPVHHVDECRSNNANTNLVVCDSHAYHRIIHTRQRVKDAGGNPHLHLVCGRCNGTKVKEDFSKYASAAAGRDGRNDICRQCCADIKAFDRHGIGSRKFLSGPVE
jgi:hypothetical protein